MRLDIGRLLAAALIAALAALSPACGKRSSTKFRDTLVSVPPLPGTPGGGTVAGGNGPGPGSGADPGSGQGSGTASTSSGAVVCTVTAEPPTAQGAGVLLDNRVTLSANVPVESSELISLGTAFSARQVSALVWVVQAWSRQQTDVVFRASTASGQTTLCKAGFTPIDSGGGFVPGGNGGNGTPTSNVPGSEVMPTSFLDSILTLLVQGGLCADKATAVAKVIAMTISEFLLRESASDADVARLAKAGDGSGLRNAIKDLVRDYFYEDPKARAFKRAMNDIAVETLSSQFADQVNEAAAQYLRTKQANLLDLTAFMLSHPIYYDVSRKHVRGTIVVDEHGPSVEKLVGSWHSHLLSRPATKADLGFIGTALKNPKSWEQRLAGAILLVYGAEHLLQVISGIYDAIWATEADRNLSVQARIRDAQRLAKINQLLVEVFGTGIEGVIQRIQSRAMTVELLYEELLGSEPFLKKARASVEKYCGPLTNSIDSLISHCDTQCSVLKVASANPHKAGSAATVEYSCDGASTGAKDKVRWIGIYPDDWKLDPRELETRLISHAWVSSQVGSVSIPLPQSTKPGNYEVVTFCGTTYYKIGPHAAGLKVEP